MRQWCPGSRRAASRVDGAAATAEAADGVGGGSGARTVSADPEVGQSPRGPDRTGSGRIRAEDGDGGEGKRVGPG